MKDLISLRCLKIIILIVSMLSVPLYSQIIIEWDEIPHIINTRWTKNIAYDQTVSLGNPGGPQTWTFVSQPMGTDSCRNIVVLPAQTPFFDSFPETNLCYMSISGSDTAFLYMRLESSFLATFGFAGNTSTGPVCQKYIIPDTTNLPEHYGDFRHYNINWNLVLDSTMYYEYHKKGFEYINAYGTVIVPYGSFPCLRYVLWDTLISTLYYNNQPIMTDTATHIGHQFVAENYSGVVCIQSQEGETNPYFTNAAVLERLTYFYQGIKEFSNNKVNKPLLLVYPNPFTDYIKFDINSKIQKSASLTLFDATGRYIKNFIIGDDRVIFWNGIDDDGNRLKPGVYFYRIVAGKQIEIGKLIRIK